ncbi:rhodanese-like domain-containing protein [Aeoliella mucimassa]|uniref:Inner membrane protein YgaP n=1 Tax=Aeoliella mucimassa TaxID=2527972 RepID=A0A518AVH9_9BACT|nr:rhodanese-like domain-containing protein [Aeoliella mucimassa]QDU58739.1 Inner membrane protein YgaP [Aeoliella mucimassa]
MAVQNMSPEEFKQVHNSGNVTLIDVRTPVEFREIHVRGAMNVPLDRLSADNVPQRSEDEPLYVVCQKGGRSAQACQKLDAAGVQNIVNVEGGTMGCHAAGMPVVKGKKAISLERQVRIAAGLLVLTGVGLSFVHPAWIALSGFVGAGLVFAGVTDTCGMGMLLARMPWNQVTDTSCCTTNVKSAA